MNRKRMALVTLLWVLTILETLTMGLSGAAKFMGDTWQRMFAEWGYPVWFASVVGGLEVVGALLLLVPRVAPFAAGGLIVIMVGALVTEIRHAQLGLLMPVVHLSVLTAIVLLRRRLTAVKAGA